MLRDSSQVTISQGGGGFSRFQMAGLIEGCFLGGLKFSIPGLFWGRGEENVASFFIGGLI